MKNTEEINTTIVLIGFTILIWSFVIIKQTFPLSIIPAMIGGALIGWGISR